MSEPTPLANGNISRDQVQQVLDPLLQDRARLAPIGEFYGVLARQEPADPRYVFELRKNGSDYTLHPTDAGTTFVPEADGDFIYVIKANDPGRVYVAIDQRLGAPALRKYGVEGHTSFDNGGDVLYAGELSFNQGRLLSWDNSSGHYRPSGEARHTNMLPVVRNMLPESLFASMTKPLTIRVGTRDIRVDDLRAMGARVDGRLLWAVALKDGLSALQHNLENRIQFKAQYLVGGHRGSRARLNAEILLEVAASRSSGKPLVLVSTGDSMLVAAMNHQLGRLKTAVGRALGGAKSNAVTYLMPGGGIVRQTGASLQVFGIYNSVRGLSAAIERGDTGEALLQASGIGAQGASLAAEAAIPALGRYLQAGNVTRFNAFAASSIGQRLGGAASLGSNIGRSGAAAGTLITLPFDIYNAVTSFQQAAQASGHAAQDHYVNAGLATAGAALSVGISAAAFAGVSAAGPLGVIAGLGLAIGGGIYHSVRYVDDLDRYASLSAGERLVTGMVGFLGGSASQEIEDRVAVARARAIYQRAKRQQLQTILTEKNWRVAIFGDAVIIPQRPIEQWATGFTFDPHDDVIDVLQQPPKVIDNAADDSINASAGLRGVGNRVRNKSSSSDTILWATGDGNDRLLGALKRTNVFSLRRGTKAVRGGERDDIFMLNAAPRSGSAFDGGAGTDTLVLARRGTVSGDTLSTARVVLDHDDQGWQWDTSPDTYIEVDANGQQHSRRKSGMRVSPGGDAGRLEWAGRVSALRSIENVITAANTATAITGNHHDNVFVLNGHGDSAAGLGGNDTYVVNGGGNVRLDTGAGDNRFRLAREIERVDIWSGSGRDHVMLAFDLDEIEARVVGRELVVRAGNDGAPKEIRFHGLLGDDGEGAQVARRNDGDLLLWTRDGLVLAPVLSAVAHAEDGLIEFAVTPASGLQEQSMELLLQYASTFAAAPEGMASAAAGSGIAVAGQLAMQGVLASPSLA